jgi:hypothetical protein
MLAAIDRAASRPLSRLAVPMLSARTMGQFRVAFGTLLFYVVLTDPPRATPLVLQHSYSWLADWPWVHTLASSAAACQAVHVATLAAIACFAVGLIARAACVAVAAGLFVTRLVDLQSNGTHDWDLPLLTLAVLTVVPWGHGFSLDRRLSGRPCDERRAGEVYGLAIWIPGLTLGLALAAAAYAKLTNGGLAWITSGAVRYHFVEDAANAPLDWGLWVASRAGVAVLLSFGAVVLEGAFIANIFVRSVWGRLAFGAAGLLLFAGLYVFQGVFWWPWVMLLVVFLPWSLLDRARPVPIDGGSLTPRHGVAIAAVVAQQIAASVTATEIEPLISPYAMYSGTYESPEAFERARYRKFQRLVFSAEGADVTPRLEQIAQAPEHLLNAAELRARGDAVDDDLRQALWGLRSEYRARFGGDVPEITVSAERVLFDWKAGRFKDPVRVRLATVPLPAGDDRE